tara:strand:- start:1562 stop:1690 length:129 start_codon:yes stop_codon:yes gene_type:complete
MKTLLSRFSAKMKTLVSAYICGVTGIEKALRGKERKPQGLVG